MEDKAIYCTCCGKEKLAEIRDGKLVILAKRHGEKHMAVLPLAGSAQTLTFSPKGA